MNITRGLESVGNTCFGTHYWAAASLQCCLEAIRILVKEGKVMFGVHLLGSLIWWLITLPDPKRQRPSHFFV
jgi:hypothetical protein